MAQWFRWWHGTFSDPKLQACALRAKTSRLEVIGVWAAVLEHASQAEPRGSVANLDIEGIAIAYATEIERVEAIVAAFRDKLLIVDGCVASWEKRQPQREDGGATQRSRRFREKRNAVQRMADGVACVAPDESCVAGDSATHQSRAEQNRSEQSRGTRGEPTGERKLFAGPCPPDDWDRQLAELGLIVERLKPGAAKLVTSYTSQATRSGDLTPNQRATLRDLHAEAKDELEREAVRQLEETYPGCMRATTNKHHGAALAAALLAVDHPEIARLMDAIANDLTDIPDHLRRGAA